MSISKIGEEEWMKTVFSVIGAILSIIFASLWEMLKMMFRIIGADLEKP